MNSVKRNVCMISEEKMLRSSAKIPKWKVLNKYPHIIILDKNRANFYQRLVYHCKIIRSSTKAAVAEYPKPSHITVLTQDTKTLPLEL